MVGSWKTNYVPFLKLPFFRRDMFCFGGLHVWERQENAGNFRLEKDVVYGILGIYKDIHGIHVCVMIFT